MIFQKEKVYTAVNADEVKVGSKGYFANTFAELKSYVSINCVLEKIDKIFDDSRAFRFSSCNTETNYALFYLVEEPKEKKYRPYKNIDEMIVDFLERYNSFNGNANEGNPMYCPLIWIKEKFSIEKDYCPSAKYLLGALDWMRVGYFGSHYFTLEKLFDDYTYLDGTPCGKLEE